MFSETKFLSPATRWLLRSERPNRNFAKETYYLPFYLFRLRIASSTKDWGQEDHGLARYGNVLRTISSWKSAYDVVYE